MHINLEGSQRGVALLVSLVILILISLLATTSLKSSINQEIMSRNSQEKSLTLQLSESAVEGTLGDLTLLTRVTRAGGNPVSSNFSNHLKNIETDVHYVHIGKTPIDGWSLGSGGAISWFHVTSEASSVDNCSRSKTEHGYYRVNPPSGN